MTTRTSAIIDALQDIDSACTELLRSTGVDYQLHGTFPTRGFAVHHKTHNGALSYQDAVTLGTNWAQAGAHVTITRHGHVIHRIKPSN